MHVKARLGLMTTASVAIVLVVTGTSFLSVSNLIEDQQTLGHSRQVISQFHSMMYHLSAAAGDERGYLLSGQLSYLEDYRSQYKLTQAAFTELKELIKDNPAQIHLLDELGGILEERLKSFDQTITVYQTLGADAAYERVKSGQGQQFLQKVRALEKDFEQEEERLLAQRKDEMQRSIRAAQLSLLAGALLSITLVAVFNFFFGRHIVTCIRTLLNASENAQQGRFNIVDLDADDEFGELAQAFNAIGLSMQERSRQLRDAEIEQDKNRELIEKQREAIQQLNGLIDELAVEFQGYYATVDRSRDDLEFALDSLINIQESNGELAVSAKEIIAPLQSATQKSVSMMRSISEVRRLLHTIAENLSSLKQSLAECSEHADKLSGLQSELDNISNALEVISMSADMAGPNSHAVLGSIMTRLHEMGKRCHDQRQFIGESISRMQTLLSRGLLTTHASSGAESSSRALIDGLASSIEVLINNLNECEVVSTAAVTQMLEQLDALESCRTAIAGISEVRKEQSQVLARLQESVGQQSDEFVPA